MNHNVSRGKWKQIKGETRKQWGRLTDDEMDMFEGEQNKLSGRLQENFGHVQDKLDRVIDDRRTAPGD